MVSEKDPTLVFLMETKFDVSEMDGIKRKIERQQGLVVPSIKRAVGLALLWRNSLQVDIQTYSPRHIDAIVTEEQGTKKWHFTGFYGHPETGQWEESWKLLENLSHKSNLPWICMGDYNEIMHAKEKEGGGVRPEGQMHKFHEAVNRCQLRDLGYMGSDFTWSRRIGSNIHDTHIVLIPKTKNPERVIDYRPISLCNMAYKIASKVVANKMKSVLQES